MRKPKNCLWNLHPLPLTLNAYDPIVVAVRMLTMMMMMMVMVMMVMG